MNALGYKRMLTLMVIAQLAGCKEPDEGIRWCLARGYVVVDSAVPGREYRITGDGIAAIERFAEAGSA